LDDLFCPSCRLRQPVHHTYCVACGDVLPSHLLPEVPAKAARFFAGIRIGDSDPENGHLKVSCYLRDHTIESPEGSVTIPGNHVRFSMWVDSQAKCVMSLPASEAREVAHFILAQVGNGSVTPDPSFR